MAGIMALWKCDSAKPISGFATLRKIFLGEIVADSHIKKEKIKIKIA